MREASSLLIGYKLRMAHMQIVLEEVILGHVDDVMFFHHLAGFYVQILLTHFLISQIAGVSVLKMIVSRSEG
jgi:hypothetical protein